MHRERKVNETLRTVHDDVSALRRYLVEAGLSARTRDGSRYWRAGGSHGSDTVTGPAAR